MKAPPVPQAPACQLRCDVFPPTELAQRPDLTLSLSQALRSHDHSTKPLYVSVGHKISLEAAVRLTHSCCKFRIPEPVRQVSGLPGRWASTQPLLFLCPWA